MWGSSQIERKANRQTHCPIKQILVCVWGGVLCCQPGPTPLSTEDRQVAQDRAARHCMPTGDVKIREDGWDGLPERQILGT